MTALETWAKGYGIIRHSEQTRDRIAALAERLVESGSASTQDLVYEALSAADRLASAAMWVVVHMTYARRVDLSGDLAQVHSPKAHSLLDPQGMCVQVAELT